MSFGSNFAVRISKENFVVWTKQNMKTSFKCTLLFNCTKIDFWIQLVILVISHNRVWNGRIMLKWIEWQEEPFSVNEDYALVNHIDCRNNLNMQQLMCNKNSIAKKNPAWDATYVKFSMSYFFLDPRPWPEGSYELGSVRPFAQLPFRPSIWKFSWDWFISFFWSSAWW